MQNFTAADLPDCCRPYIEYLTAELSPARLQHSLGVMQTLLELAPIYALDEEQAALTGLLHDAAKELSPGRRAALATEAGLSQEQPWEQDFVNGLHGPLSAYLVQHELDIQDRLVLDAIAAHTFWGGGANFDHPLSWCLRFADILEPYRRWDDHARWLRAGSPRLHALAYSGQLEAAACMHAGLLVHFFTEMNIPINPNLRRAYQERAARLPQAQAWFDLDLA